MKSLLILLTSLTLTTAHAEWFLTNRWSKVAFIETPADNITDAIRWAIQHKVICPAIDLSGQNLSGLNLDGFQAPFADLTDLVATNVSLVGANFRGAKVDNLRLSGHAERLDLSLSAGTNANLSGLIAPGLVLANSTIQGLQLNGSKVQSVNMKSAKLDAVEFAEADLAEAVTEGVTSDVKASLDAKVVTDTTAKEAKEAEAVEEPIEGEPINEGALIDGGKSKDIAKP